MSLVHDHDEFDLDHAVGVVATASLPDRRAEAAVSDLLLALGFDVADPDLVETPRRVVASFRELLHREPLTMTTFPNEEGYDELVLVREIPFTSLCAHHLLPFRGVAHVGYLPAERLLGLSKLARVVEHFAGDLQLQERLTVQIADFLASELAPNGVGVVLEAEHLCMSIRGANAPTARTQTARFTGALAEHGWERFRDASRHG
ncbi:GTP cyclohydrolase I [Agromyces ramosus]|jgi:GTP cyclohydrolase I|uniref:GTP cyclohydrolase 1 n=1 Tax=Agromyces ramosus TaxID=33879 RepID=A0A4Q7MHB7_9MICO|nr:GTP cyclohydrolase I [Agromyces ramosus]RZS65849.1 GTP cyclohydrolase I [Agromyces ramosus]